MKPQPKARFCSLCGLAFHGIRQRELGLIACRCPWSLPFGQWPLALRKKLLAAVRKPTEGAA